MAAAKRDVTVVIPTHNGSQRVGQLLEALLKQEIPGVLFEVVVIDNASTDSTAQTVLDGPFVSAFSKKEIPLRVVIETEKGLTFARLRGIHEAQGEYVCFLDDDNLPASDYVAEGVKAFRTTNADTLTSRVFARYEADPPVSVRRREHLLAINDALGDSPLDFGTGATLAPTLGAGMWVRKSLFLKAVPVDRPAALLCDRLGGQLTSGGDIEIGYLMGASGARRMYWPGLVIWHCIPPQRFELRYFTRLIMGVVRSKATLEARYAREALPPANIANRFFRLLFCMVSLPAFIFRSDGLRDYWFALVARWAEFLGPYASHPDLRRDKESI